MVFMMVRSTSVAYNVILGRPLLNDMRAVVSPCYLLMKFPTPHGIGQVRGDQKKARTCYIASTTCKGVQRKETLNIEKPPKPRPVEEVEGIALFKDDQSKKVFVGKQLEEEMKMELVECLR